MKTLAYLAVAALLAPALAQAAPAPTPAAGGAASGGSATTSSPGSPATQDQEKEKDKGASQAKPKAEKTKPHAGHQAHRRKKHPAGPGGGPTSKTGEPQPGTDPGQPAPSNSNK